MNRSLLTFAICAASIGALTDPPAQSTGLPVCYSVRLGTWSGPNPSWTPPSAFMLDTVPVIDDSTPKRRARHTFLVRPESPGRPLPQWLKPRWWRSARDSLLVSWSNGFSGLQLQLTQDGDSLRGVAQTFTDVIGPMHPSAPVSAVRMPCAQMP